MPSPTSPKGLKGPIYAVPCPHCGKTNDLRGLQEQIGAAFEKGAVVDCDHCGHCAMVTAVQPVTFVAVIQDPKGRRRQDSLQQRAAAPARTVSRGSLMRRR